MTDTPLVVLCIDAADPDLLVQWAAEGHLPSLHRAMERGWWGRVGGPELNIEHGAWVSLLSGISRAQHGYHYFRQLQTGSYDLRLVAGHEIDAPPFWAHLADGARIAVVDVPDIRPIPGLRGVQLSDWAVHNPEAEPSALPASVLTDAERVFGPHDPIEERLRSTEAEDRAIYERLLARVPRKGALVRHLIRGGDCDLVVAGFGEAHTGGHQLWTYRPGNPFGVADGPLTHATRTLYQAIDCELGRLVESVGEANVVVLSSVGMRDQFPMTGISEAFFRELGYQASPPPSSGRSWRPLDLARRWLPESLRIALSRRLPRERREALLADQYRTGTDWARTTAFSVPSAYATFARINLQGREPEGTVAPEEYGALLDRIEADFLKLVDPETGERVVECVERTRDVFGPDASDDLPDLFVHWRPIPRFLRRVSHPRAELVQDEPEFFRESDHTRWGFMAAAGPAFDARGAVGEIDALDVAPTLWAALGRAPLPAFVGAPRHLAPLLD
ncbi:alkaline phosphatase family protein [Rubrivirga sp. IMCC43871]|uniref:alkaline phosphatase family protein n=1 Tax=Rubrivirga sp. IMCC43871 TaxID=3391575 RepID=UPI00398FA64F